MPSMTVMKAKMRRPAELVLIGVKGMNISQVSFPNSATKKEKKIPSFSKMSNRVYTACVYLYSFDLIRLKRLIRQLTVKLGSGP